MTDPVHIASEWHNGQWSALYSYASTGMIHSEEHRLDALWEVERELERFECMGAEEMEYAGYTERDVADLSLLHHELNTADALG